MITAGGEEAPKEFGYESAPANARVGTGRSAPEIIAAGLENLGKEPFGWFYGKPSALTSTLAPEPTVAQGLYRQMGAKELARSQAASAAAMAAPAAQPYASPNREL